MRGELRRRRGEQGAKPQKGEDKEKASTSFQSGYSPNSNWDLVTGVT